MQVVHVAAMAEYEEQAKAKHSHDVSRQRQKEEEKVAVVPPPDTIVHPWTVVIKVLQRNQEEKKNHNSITQWNLYLKFSVFSIV